MGQIISSGSSRFAIASTSGGVGSGGGNGILFEKQGLGEINEINDRSINSKNNMEIESRNDGIVHQMNMNMESFELWMENSRWWRACVAGSIAGLAEHSLLYPVDTVKTRLQSIVHHKDGLQYKGFNDAFYQIVRHEGPHRLFRGLPAVLTAAIPSHAAYFGSYEYAKYKLGATRPGYHILATALAGVFATMSHDFIVTPFDVIKQRMQLKNCPYANICQCAIRTFKREGILSFVRSYPTTVILNIPVFSTNFVCYESFKIFLSTQEYLKLTLSNNNNNNNNENSNRNRNKNSKNEENSLEDSWIHHLVAGGLAGACAGFISNPLDLIKTTIQTEKSQGYRSIRHTISHIMAEHPEKGYFVFLSGATARMIYFVPSAAITWTTYEAVKKYLGFPIHDLEMH